jgi:phosphohistidine phosphatase
MTAPTLVLLRHAKAENPPGIADIDRPLSARGHADSAAAGAWLAARHVPGLVICSPAKRTRQTWHGVAVALPGATAPVVRYDPTVYEGGAADLLRVVRGIDDAVATALLIGHNPSLSRLAFLLDPDSDIDSDGLRTCGLSVHVLDGAWRECGEGGARVAATHTARG